MRDTDCVAFLQWALPALRMRWPGFRRVRRQVCRRLARRLRTLELPDLAAYRRYLTDHPAEWQLLDACCRITVSRFYRDRSVFEALGRRVLPELAALASAAGRGTLYAWSAGCGSGEEVYSLRGLWQLEVAPRHPGLRLHVIGTDAEATCIARARRGCYSASSLRELPRGWRERVFLTPADSQQPDELCVRAAFREGVELREQDLRRTMPEGPFDLVLCRNLAFTYFDTELQRELLERILRRLVVAGALVIGVHERLPFTGDATHPEPPGIAAWGNAPAIYRARRAPEPAAPLTIECRVDPTSGDPVAFGRHGALRPVVAVIDRWPGEGHRYFRVRTADGAVQILRHDEESDRWALHYFERGETATRGHSER